jgi:hypothetical protein
VEEKGPREIRTPRSRQVGPENWRSVNIDAMNNVRPFLDVVLAQDSESSLRIVVALLDQKL